MSNERLWEEMRPYVERMAKRMFLNFPHSPTIDQQDVVQEARYWLLKGIEKFNDGREVNKDFLLKYVNTNVMYFLRRQSALYTGVHNNAPIFEAWEPDEVDVEEVAVPSQVETVLVWIDLENAMNELGDRERNIVWLRLQDVTFREIGERMGISRQRVNQIWQRAVSCLRERLSEYA